ncbi:MAG: hypothetical protein PHI35_05495, partial [Victivallaceae bacterium]|nr:hypothetical protein [Victivallaceae bacterium]
MEIVTRKLVAGGAVVICAMVAVCCAAADADSVDPQRKNPAESSRVLGDSVRSESDRRFADQDKTLTEARGLAKDKKYAEASKLYDSLEKELREMNSGVDFPVARSRFEDVQDERLEFRRAWASSLMDQAESAEADKRFAEAMTFASDAQSICPDYAGAANDLITRCQAHMKAEEKRGLTSLEQFDTDLANREAQIKQLLAEARVFYRNRKFDKARKTLEKVYILNPAQPEAIEMMARIWREYFTYAIKRSDADAAGMLAYNAWSWSEPVFVATETVKQQSGVPEEAKKDGVYAKMERIVFPNFKLEASDVTEAIKMLSRRSTTLDPEREGVLIETEYDPNKVRLPKITLDFSGISMLDLLQIICEDAGLVMNAAADGSVSVAQDRSSDRSARFTIRGDFLSRLESEVGSGDGDTEAAPAADGADGEASAEEPKAAPVVGNSALSKYFIARGVPVGSKTKISLLKNKLIINDASYECIRDIEEYLTKLDALEDLLVQVEIRTAEISEIDIQELGFDWSLSNNTSTTGSILNKTTNNSAWSFNQPTKFLRDVPTTITGETSNSAVVKDLNIFPALFGSTNPFGSDIPLNISLTINALCQNTRAET